MAPTYPSKRKYERETMLKVTVGFNRHTEPELVEMIEAQDSRAGFLKGLARRELPTWQSERKAEKEADEFTEALKRSQAEAVRKRREEGK